MIQVRSDLSSSTRSIVQGVSVIRVSHKGQWCPGVVNEEHCTPRSFIITTDDGSVLRRNRRDLVKTHESKPLCQPHDDEVCQSVDGTFNSTVSEHSQTVDSTLSQAANCNDSEQFEHSQKPVQTMPAFGLPKQTRSGRVTKPPVRFKDYT